MTNADYVHATLIVDRSFSMSNPPEKLRAAEDGVNQFLEEQKDVPGDFTVTLVQFDDTYELVANMRPIQDFNSVYELKPRGNTALLDAVGKAIVTTGEELSKLPDQARPGKVVVLIVTDGEENSSREYTKEDVQRLVKQQEDVYGWEFHFIGAGPTAWAERMSLGIAHGTQTTDNAKGYAQTYAAVSSAMTTTRTTGAGYSSSMPDEIK